MSASLRRTAMAGLIGVFVLGGLAQPAAAQAPVPVGGEFQVNTYTTGGQERSRISFGPSGEFVVVWDSTGSSGSDSDSSSIHGRRYASDGTALGGDFQINTYTNSYQQHPDVSIGPDGKVWVVWLSDGSNFSDGSAQSIQARVFDSGGTAFGSDFQLNTFTNLAQLSPRLSFGPDGHVVVWYSAASGGGDNSSNSIQARRHNSSGTALGSDFQVNTYTLGAQREADVAVGPGGEFVVVWDSDGSIDSDSSGQSIQGKRYNSAGASLASDFQINTFTTNDQHEAEVAIGPGGEFVVVWQSYGSSDSDSDNHSIQGRRYASDGTALGSEFQVNTHTTGPQRYPGVSIGPDGEFVVVWENWSLTGSDSVGQSIRGRLYASDGTALGSDFQVNTYTMFGQREPDVSTGPGGEFVVVWKSKGSSANDSDDYSIQGQRYVVPLFGDGFESGDTSAWSSSVP